MKMPVRHILIMLLVMQVFLPAAASDWVFLGGLEVDGQGSYAYAGGITPIGASNLGQGYQARIWLDRLQYEYKANGEQVTAVAPGAQLAVGFKNQLTNGAWAVYGGIGQRNTQLSPDQPGADNRGVRTGVALLAETYQLWSGGWRSDQAISYEFSPGSYWLRIKGGKEAGFADLRHSLAVIVNDGPEYHSNKVGYTLEGLRLGKGLNMNTGIGIGKSRDRDVAAYIVMELVYVVVE